MKRFENPIAIPLRLTVARRRTFINHAQIIQHKDTNTNSPFETRNSHEIAYERPISHMIKDILEHTFTRSVDGRVWRLALTSINSRESRMYVWHSFIPSDCSAFPHKSAPRSTFHGTLTTKETAINLWERKSKKNDRLSEHKNKNKKTKDNRKTRNWQPTWILVRSTVCCRSAEKNKKVENAHEHGVPKRNARMKWKLSK